MDSASPSPILLENASNKVSSKSEEDHKEWEEGECKNMIASKECMDRAIMNYLITAGYKEAAERFSVESGVKFERSRDDVEHRIIIKRFILQGEILAGIEYINRIYPELLENKKHLYFRLLQQQTIEMIREKKEQEALEFAQKHLVEKVVEDAKLLTEVEHTLTLLAFSEPSSSPYGHLLLPVHRQKVAKDVNTAVLAYCNEEESSEVGQLVQSIIWSQDELENHKSSYPRMINIGDAAFAKNT